MDSIRLANLEKRLAAMNTRNDDLRKQLEQRGTEHQEMVKRHREVVAQLEQQLTILKARQDAERKVHEAETVAATTRRQQVKEDYGELYELVGQLKKAQEADEAQPNTEA